MEKMMIPPYSTMTFTDIYKEVNEFVKDYKEVGIPETISEESAKLSYYLIYARYGNSPIANRDINQFKYKLFVKIFQFGPTWEKRLEIQNKLRNLSDEELMLGSKQIYNHAFNDASAPTEQSIKELPFINDQNTTNNKRSKLDAYAFLWELMKVDVSEGYIRQFGDLFKQFVRNENPILYADKDCDDSEEVDVNGI